MDTFHLIQFCCSVMPAGCQRRPRLRGEGGNAFLRPHCPGGLFFSLSQKAFKAQKRDGESFSCEKGNTLLTSIWEKRKIKQQSFADDIFVISTAKSEIRCRGMFDCPTKNCYLDSIFILGCEKGTGEIIYVSALLRICTRILVACFFQIKQLRSTVGAANLI